MTRANPMRILGSFFMNDERIEKVSATWEPRSSLIEVRIPCKAGEIFIDIPPDALLAMLGDLIRR